jgi:Spy/CpxP family protein refolding chaperone
MMKSISRNTVRCTLLGLVCAAGLSAPMLAQEPTTPPPPPPQGGWQGHGGDRQEHMLEHLTKALNLTPDQVTQIKAIQTDTRSQMEALHQDTSTAQADKRAKMMSIRQAQEAKIKAVLNDDQKAKYDAMQAKMRERQQERRNGDDAPPPPPPPPAV